MVEWWSRRKSDVTTRQETTVSKGGFKAFRGSAATAESYLLERDTANLDDYYREGKDRVVEHGIVTGGGVEMGTLTPEKFRAWMEHRDPETDEVRGVIRHRKDIDKVTGEMVDNSTPLYQETILSVSKTLSLAAAANPRVAAALEAAMGRACEASAQALAEHAVTRIGAKGSQRYVKLDRIEFTSVQHTTSRAGDPHYHRHMQILPRGMVNGEWRSLDGRTLYRHAELVNSTADHAISTDAEFRQVLAAEGYSWVPGQGGGDITEFLGMVDQHSTRRDQIDVNREALEIEWRIANPGQEPGPRQRQAWDTHAWAQDRPTKEPAQELTPEAMAERIGAIEPQNIEHTLYGQTADQITPETIAQGALEDLARSRSAWCRGDMIAAINRRLADTYLIGGDGVEELRFTALGYMLEHSVSFLDEGVNIDGVRHYTSTQVLATDQQLTDALITRALIPGDNGTVQGERDGFTLSEEQQFAAEAIAGTHQLVVIQGAAGAGKTTMLQAAAESVQEQGRRLLVISPTKRGALEAGDVLGTDGDSVHALLYRAGATVDEDTGRWVLPAQWKAQPEAWRMDEHTVLVVDEAGMLDQDTAAALHSYIDAHHVGTLVLSGDASQLAAVGRGGYLARASQLAGVSLDLTDVRRFRTPEGDIDHDYAALSLRMRDRDNPETIFDELAARGLVNVGTLEDQLDRIADTVALEEQHGTDSIVIAPTNAAAGRINHAVFERLADARVLDTSTIAHGRDGDPIAAGVRIATRQNDRELGVANRQTWTVQHVNADGRITVTDTTGHRRTLDADYVRENVQLAYAVTGHGAQGMTVGTAHTILSDEVTAAGAYVGLTRGRAANVLHVVGYDMNDARAQFADAFERDGADQGIEAAQEQVRRDLEGIDISEDRTRITERIEQLTHTNERAERNAGVWDSIAAKFAELENQHTTELAQLKQAVELAQETAQARRAEVLAPLTEQASNDGDTVAVLREQLTQAQQETRSAGRFGRRRAENIEQKLLGEWQQACSTTEQTWGSYPSGRYELEKWAERVSNQKADQDPRTRDSARAALNAQIELKTASEKHRFEAQGLARQLKFDDATTIQSGASGERRATRNAQAWRKEGSAAKSEAAELAALPTEQAVERLDKQEAAAALEAAQAAQREAAMKDYWQRQHQSAPHQQPGHGRGIGFGR
ncbi:MAG: hypothetical protein D3X82_18105 [Candidatus Leucobacter sulfamidivorax]|jgi:anion-transporting  ArsA/GET3 family ATPase|nr:hypothetical protein [Candidatus Leucobacter sulfamidivorax]